MPACYTVTIRAPEGGIALLNLRQKVDPQSAVVGTVKTGDEVYAAMFEDSVVLKDQVGVCVRNVAGFIGWTTAQMPDGTNLMSLRPVAGRSPHQGMTHNPNDLEGRGPIS